MRVWYPGCFSLFVQNNLSYRHLEMNLFCIFFSILIIFFGDFLSVCLVILSVIVSHNFISSQNLLFTHG